MSGRKKRIPMMLAVVILSLFLAVFPAFSAFAFYYYPISSDGKTQYKVKVKIETTSAAGGWNKAYVEFYTKGQNGQDDESEKDMTCSISDVDDKGDVCNLSGDFEGFPSRIRVYSDFGGGMTWRSWEADVTVYVNNVNVTSKHIYASSSPFSSSDCYNTISIDETKYPYPSSIKFYAPGLVDSDEPEVNTLVSAVIKDQYGVVWTADNPSLTDQDTDYKTMPISAGTYAWEVSCKGPVDRKVIYTLKVPTGNTLKGTVEKTFNIDYRFPRTLTLTDGNGFKKTVTGYQGQQVPVRVPELEKEGVALSWNHTGGGAYMPNATGGPRYTFGAEDGTLTAEYKAYTYTVMFMGNGNTSGSMSGRKYTCGNTYTLISNTYSKRGHEFVEWNTKADGTGTAYPNKATVKNLATTDGAVVNLYAQWKIKEYTVTFVNKQTKEKIVQTVPYEGAAEAPELSPVPGNDEIHYIFSKWNKAFDKITANTTVNSTFEKEAHTFRDITAGEAEKLGLGTAAGRYCEICGHFIPEVAEEDKTEATEEGKTEAVGKEKPEAEDGTATLVGNGVVWIIIAGGVLAIAVILILVIRRKKVGRPDEEEGEEKAAEEETEKAAEEETEKAAEEGSSKDRRSDMKKDKDSSGRGGK